MNFKLNFKFNCVGKFLSLEHHHDELERLSNYALTKLDNFLSSLDDEFDSEVWYTYFLIYLRLFKTDSEGGKEVETEKHDNKTD